MKYESSHIRCWSCFRWIDRLLVVWVWLWSQRWDLWDCCKSREAWWARKSPPWRCSCPCWDFRWLWAKSRVCLQRRCLHIATARRCLWGVAPASSGAQYYWSWRSLRRLDCRSYRRHSWLRLAEPSWTDHIFSTAHRRGLLLRTSAHYSRTSQTQFSSLRYPCSHSHPLSLGTSPPTQGYRASDFWQPLLRPVCLFQWSQ